MVGVRVSLKQGNDCVSSSERASAIGVFELPNAVERISKGTKAVADPG